VQQGHQLRCLPTLASSDQEVGLPALDARRRDLLAPLERKTGEPGPGEPLRETFFNVGFGARAATSSSSSCANTTD
jgi:hypothetical protein